MNTYKTIFFQVLTFFAGGMFLINVSSLVPINEAYPASWSGALLYVILAVVFSIQAHSYSRQTKAAYEAAHLIVAAYESAETNQGSIDWEDLNDAFEIALQATGKQTCFP